MMRTPEIAPVEKRGGEGVDVVGCSDANKTLKSGLETSSGTG